MYNSLFSYRQVNRKIVPAMLALSLGVSQVPLAFAGPGDINSVNVGTDVQSGTYYNTNDSQTSFISGTTLTVGEGTNVRGLEVNNGGSLTGNGGNLYFGAPAIYIKGKVDVSGIMGSGYETSNGGHVTFNADFFLNQGIIYAGGTNGGVINVNAGTATFAPGSLTAAPGLGGAGGTININGSGVVDIQSNGQNPNSKGYLAGVIDASGKQIGTIDTSVINIQGAVVNNDGIVRANGYVVADANVVHLYNETIQQPNGNAVAKTIPSILRPQEGTLMTTGSEGGTVRIASTGAGGEGNNGGCIADCDIDRADNSTPGFFAEGEAAALKTRINTLLADHNGDVVIGPTGVVQVDGSSVSFLPGKILGHKIIDKGYGYYESQSNSDHKVIASVFDNSDTNFNHGYDGGVILINARRDVDVNTANIDGKDYGGLLSARGGNGNGYDYQTNPHFEGKGFAKKLVFDTAHATFDAGNGGFINVNAQHDVNWAGSAHAFGGNGYQNFRGLNPAEEALLAGKTLPNGYIFDNQDMATGGLGGSGGTIAFSYGHRFNNTVVDGLNAFYLAPGFSDKTLVNFQQIDASGGHTGKFANGLIEGNINPYGGLVVFSGPTNPNNARNISVYRGQGPDLYWPIDTTRFGTVVLPNASNATTVNQLKTANTNFNPDASQLHIDQLHEDEVLIGRDTLVLLSRSNYDNLWDKFDHATVRSDYHADQFGGAGYKLQGIAPDIKNLVVANHSNNDTLVLNIPASIEGGNYWLMNEGNTDFTNLTALMVLNSNRGDGVSRIVNNEKWEVGRNNPNGGLINLMSDGRIINNNMLAVTGTWFDGSVTLASNRSIINNGWLGGYGDAETGASVILKACRDITNNGYWSSGGYDGDYYYPGEFIEGGVVDALGRLNGGRIDMFANNNILNLGKIKADSDYMAGSIFSYAGNNNLNFGRYSASAGLGVSSPVILSKVAAVDKVEGDFPISELPSGNGYGGRIRLHGNNIAANIDIKTIANNPEDTIGFGPGQISTTGSNTGGSVYLTSGESCGVGCQNNNPTNQTDGAGGFVNGLIDDLLSQNNIAGFSTTQNTPPITTMDTFIDMTKPGSAVNLGHIDTRGPNGQTWLVGNGQVGVGADSSINGVKVQYDNILADADPPVAFQSLLSDMNNSNSVNLVAGFVGEQTALQAVLCSNLIPPTIPETDNLGDGNGYSFPNNFTLPGRTPNRFSADVNGLFQDYRFRNDANLPKQSAPLIIGFQQPGLFLSKAYQPITQEILKLALLEYNRVLSDANTANQGGETHKRAFEMARLYLADAGVDADVAGAILEKIQDGTFNADQNIVGVLKAMSEQPVEPNAPTQPGEDNVLRQ